MLKSEEVKKFAKKCGADLVGIASMDRFEGAPKNMDPRYINPDAKALIVFGFRIFRGCLRGIEEGTYFVSYSSMGYAGINWVYAPVVLWNFCKALEDEGYEATPIPNIFWPRTGRPVSEDKPGPDVFLHYRIAAFCAGLGEIGYGKVFLTPEFGPRQRFAAVLTDAPLEPDPLFEVGKLCDRCMLCVKDCTGEAISATETVKVEVAGRMLEWGKLDVERCTSAFAGGNEEFNPFFGTGPKGTGPNPVYEYGRALEGARGCIRACMIHLEEQGKIKNAFKKPFRIRKPWRLL